jgi:hypothetical protein
MKLHERIAKWVDYQSSAQDAYTYHTNRAIWWAARGSGYVMTAKIARQHAEQYDRGSRSWVWLDQTAKYAMAKSHECMAESVTALALAMSVRTPFQAFLDRFIEPLTAIYVKYRQDTEETRFE